MHHNIRFCALSGLVSMVLIAPSIFAATIAVTTTDDVVSIDGQCSLREAVSAANLNMPFSDCPTGEALPVIDEIELPPGTYALTLEPTGEDMNAGGDLDILEAVTVRGLGDDFIWWDDPDTPEIETLDVFNDPDGFPRTFTEADLPDVVIENGLGTPTLPGDGDRVIHVLAAGPPPPPPIVPGTPPLSGPPTPLTTLENLAIVRGDAFCSGSVCNAGSAGILHESTDDLTLRRVALFENRLSCSGFDCGSSSSAAALYMQVHADLRVLESVLAGNEASCTDSQCQSGQIAHYTGGSPTSEGELDRVLIASNTATCSAPACTASLGLVFVANDLRLTRSVITDNEVQCEAAGSLCGTGGLSILGGTVAPCDDPACSVVVEDIEVSANRTRSEAPDSEVGGLLAIAPKFTQTIQRARFHDNEIQCIGVSCEATDAIRADALPAGSLLLSDVDILDHASTCEGASCLVGSAFAVDGAGTAALSNIAVDGQITCFGARCQARAMVGLFEVPDVTDLTVSNTSVSCAGDECLASPMVVTVSLSPQSSVFTGLSITDSTATCTGTDCTMSLTSTPGQIGEGGLLLILSVAEPAAHVTLNGTTITGTMTTARGVLATNAPLDVTQSTISGNTSSSDGGGIWNGVVIDPEMPDDHPGTLTLIDTAIDGNVAGSGATGVGGAIVNPPGASLTLNGGSIANNTATDGGGIWNEGTVTFVSGAPFQGNDPNDCVNAGDGTGCIDLIFLDGFETGDTSAWSIATRSEATPPATTP